MQQQALRKTQQRAGAVRDGFQYLAESQLCRLGLPQAKQAIALFERQVGWAGRQGADKLSQARLRLHTCELSGHFAVFESLNRRDAVDAIAQSQVLVLVHIDFCQAKTALGFVRQFFQHRPQHLARAAPFRPEIHNHRDLLRISQHFIFEVGFGYVFDEIWMTS